MIYWWENCKQILSAIYYTDDPENMAGQEVGQLYLNGDRAWEGGWQERKENKELWCQQNGKILGNKAVSTEIKCGGGEAR